MIGNPNSKPNILLIMDDQHRYDYLGCTGAPFVRTPNLDRLASRGVSFTHCFANSPLCAPSRIGLAAGMDPHRLGAVDNGCSLPPHASTYYQRLRDGGYRVGCVGKLDLGKPSPYNGRYGDRPSVYRWGFTHPEECEGKMHAGSSPTPLGPYGWHLQERGLLQAFHADYSARAKSGFALACRDSVLPANAFEDAYIGRRAAEWIERVPDDFPWFCFVGFVGPHDPYDPPASYADKYRDAAMPPALPFSPEGKPEWVRRRFVTDDPATVAVTRRQYCAAIEAIDDQVGAILDALDRRGMTDRTYIVFASDHGELLGDHGLYQKAAAYEPAVRVPLLVSGPGIAGGRTSSAFVELNDLNPTVCEFAGLPGQAGIDARSFAPALFGEAKAHRDETMSCGYNFRSLRTDRYKLIQNVNDRFELYDLAEDPGELRNVAEAEPERVKELYSRLRRRLRS